LWTGMINAMQFWVTETDLDGFRCDVAGLVPTTFWERARQELDATKPLFMLAEWSEPELHRSAFDMTYGWDLHDIMKDVPKGKADARAFHTWVKSPKQEFPRHAFRMHFTNNHDKNSWEGTDQELFGPAYEAMAVLSRDYDPTIVYFTRPALGQAWSAVVHAASAGVAQDPSEKLYHRMRGLETAHEKLARDYPTAVRVEYGNQDSVTAFVQTLGVLQREWTYHPRNVVRRIRLHRTVRFLEQNTPRRQNVAGYESAAVSLEFARGLTMLPPAPPHRWKQYQEFLHAVQADLVADPEAPAFPTSADLRQRAVDLGGERGSLLDERELAAVIEYLNRPKTEAFAEEQDCLDDLRAIVSRLASSQPTG